MPEGRNMEIVRDLLEEKTYRRSIALVEDIWARFGFREVVGQPLRSGCLQARAQTGG